MSVLVDTGVWLRFFRGEQTGLVARPWISGGQALVHPLVVGELLLGGLSAANEELLESLDRCEVASPRQIYDFIRRNSLAGKGMGWVDAALLTTARDAQAQLATYDLSLAGCAKELGIATPLDPPSAQSDE